MSEAVARFAHFLQLSDDMLARAEREDLRDCVRTLGRTVRPPSRRKRARGRYSETMNDAQAKWIGVSNCGLGMLDQQHPKPSI